MATTSNVIIRHGEESELNKIKTAVGSSTVLARGDLIELTSGSAVAVNAAGDNATFAGVSVDLSESGETVKVGTLLRGICKITVTSTTYDIGDSLKYSAGANGTAWSLAKATSGADGIMWSREYQASSVTTLEVQWDSFLVGGFGAAAGLWEKHAA